MTAKLNEQEWAVYERITETYVMPDSTEKLDPVAFNRLVRSRIPARGKRFNHDHHDTCAYVERSKNLNVVAYTVNFVVSAGSAEAAKAAPEAARAAAATQGPAKAAQQQYHEMHYHNTQEQKDLHLPKDMMLVPSGIGLQCAANLSHPVHPYFVRLEPSYIAARRKKGIHVDCDELRMLERKFAYGYNSKIFDCEKHIKEQSPSRVTKGGRLATALADPARKDELLKELHAWWMQLPPFAMSFVPLPIWPAFAFTLPPLSPLSTGEAATLYSAPAEGEAPWCSDEDTVPALLAIIEGELCVLEKVYVKSVERWFGLPYVEYIQVFGVSLRDGKMRCEKQSNDGKYVAPKDVTPEDVASS